MKLVLILLCLLFACFNEKDSSQALKTSDDTELEENVCAPNIKVNGYFYHTTGTLSEISDHEIDGEIISEVDDTQMPSNNDESNFGVGYKYDIINDKRIDVYISERDYWIIFQFNDGYNE